MVGDICQIWLRILPELDMTRFDQNGQMLAKIQYIPSNKLVIASLMVATSITVIKLLNQAAAGIEH